MGYITAFLGGAADGYADVQASELKKMADRERDEANFVREKSLAEYRITEASKEAEKDRTFKGEQGNLDRVSAERVAGMRVKTDLKDKSLLKLDEWYRNRMDDIDDMQAKSEITPEAAAQMRKDVDDRYMREADSGGKGLVGKVAAPGDKTDNQGGKRTVAEYTAWLKEKYPGIGRSDIDRRIAANADRLSDANVPEKTITESTEKPGKTEKEQTPESSYNATAPGGRSDRRKQASDAHEIAQNEYSNDVQTMDKAALSAWFESNKQYLTLKQIELIRQRLGKKDKGRNNAK